MEGGDDKGWVEDSEWEAWEWEWEWLVTEWLVRLGEAEGGGALGERKSETGGGETNVEEEGAVEMANIGRKEQGTDNITE